LKGGGGISTVDEAENLIVGGSIDSMIRLWDFNSGELKLKLQGHANAIRATVYDPASHQLFSGSDDQTIKLWNIETGIPFMHSARLTANNGQTNSSLTFR
jgi:WD40 repeat protein